jgi:hypothetical protein
MAGRIGPGLASRLPALSVPVSATLLLAAVTVAASLGAATGPRLPCGGRAAVQLLAGEPGKAARRCLAGRQAGICCSLLLKPTISV